ncbi:hypothetical protein [Segetibacter koreensis]|uniref:hypothetical protein n=1 Tax=Segetibacter koreensis TaxID=398037 RepID=UPI0012F7A888|nr:hypothetical protein [Segetibacter koreensis]
MSQTYIRAFDHCDEIYKTDILVTDYDDPGLAKIHLNAVAHDKYAAIIDLTKEKHRKKIREMLEPSSRYVVYWSIVKDVKEMEMRLNNRYSENMRRYIIKNTGWRIGADETIRPSFQVTFGELYIILKRSTQTLRVRFDEIEKS